MFKDSYLPRWLLPAVICVPIALLVGYLLATPLAFTSYSVLGLILLALTIPLLLQWHHALLIFLWNSYLIVFFLPGQPSLAFVLAGCSLLIAVLQHSMKGEKTFFVVPSLSRSLIFIGLVVAVTSYLTGGIGGRAFGEDTWGAKRYLGVFGAIFGYFAMSAQVVPEKWAKSFGWVYFLSGVTAVVSDLAYAAGPKFYFLFMFFPSVMAGSQVLTQDTLLRLSGVGFAAQSATFFVLARYGIRGLFDWTRPWRMAFFLLAIAGSLFGGYRSMFILALLILSVQFYFERLFRSHYFIVLLLTLGLLMSGIVMFSEKLPLSVQRSLSFLPLKVDPMAKVDAQGSLDWRLQIWKVMVPEIPKYLWMGKGFAYSGTDSYLTSEAIRRGMIQNFEETFVSGSYHQGLLTLIIPFGIWGVIGFTWFCVAALRVLYANYRFGREDLKTLNTFLLSFFVGRLIFYLAFYGQFDLDLFQFTGTVGFSIALNHGVRTNSQVTSAEEIVDVRDLTQTTARLG